MQSIGPTLAGRRLMNAAKLQKGAKSMLKTGTHLPDRFNSKMGTSTARAPVVSRARRHSFDVFDICHLRGIACLGHGNPTTAFDTRDVNSAQIPLR